MYFGKAMRLLHTSDWHLGKQLHGFGLLDDQHYAIEQLFSALKDARPDCLVIAGDIYDRATPSSDAVLLLDETLYRLDREFGRPVICISGNHDSFERMQFGSRILSRSKLFICSSFAPDRSPIVLDDPDGSVSFCPIPFLEPARAKEVFPEAAISSHRNALQAELLHMKAKLSNAHRRVLIVHAFVAGGQTCESERPLTCAIGGSEAVPAELFAGFHYVALGHLHMPQEAGEPHIRYSGSLLKYSQSESRQRKAFSLVDLDRNGACRIEELPITFKRDVRVVEGHFDELKNYPKTDDYVAIKLLDPFPVLNAPEYLRRAFPNFLTIERREQKSAALRDVTLGAELRKDQVALFKLFAKQAADLELNEQQLAFVVETLHGLDKEESHEAD